MASADPKRWWQALALPRVGRHVVVVESQIEGAFEGWTGETIYKLANAQIWQQSKYAYRYHYAYRPRVVVIQTAGGFEMLVDGMQEWTPVRRLL